MYKLFSYSNEIGHYSVEVFPQMHTTQHIPASNHQYECYRLIDFFKQFKKKKINMIDED